MTLFSPPSKLAPTSIPGALGGNRPLKVSRISPSDLSPEQLTQWRRLLRPEAGWDSPFYEPAFVELLGRYRPNLEVALFEENDRIAGVFAYERDDANRAAPPGMKLSDFHGPIFREGSAMSPEGILYACGLKSWRFDHQLNLGEDWSKWTVRSAKSRFIDLRPGFEEYARQLKSSTNLYSQVARKRRKLEREIGPVEFQWHSASSIAFDRLLEWKSAQRERTGTFDILQSSQVVAFLEEIRSLQTEPLKGVLSTLAVNGEIAAVHLGLATPTAFHYWFPTYNSDFHRYSPGLILLLEMARAAAERNIGRFDFGKGDEGYKQSFATGEMDLAEGVVDRVPLARVLRRSAYQVWEWIKSSPIYGPANQWKRWLNKPRHSATFGTPTTKSGQSS